MAQSQEYFEKVQIFKEVSHSELKRIEAIKFATEFLQRNDYQCSFEEQALLAERFIIFFETGTVDGLKKAEEYFKQKKEQKKNNITGKLITTLS